MIEKVVLDYQHVGFTYNKKTAFAKIALKDINYKFQKNKITTIIGETGSGKSTLILLANGLLRPTVGELKIIEKFTIKANQRRLKQYKGIRSKVGVVFQFPETQLFEETVLKDIIYGPTNLGKKEKEAEEIALKTIKTLNLPEKLLQNSPFDLSGGQKRLVAIAGVLAMDPDVIIFDEPTAGLDPQREKEMGNLFLKLKKEENKTVVIVTHDMELAYRISDRIILLHKGEIMKEADPFSIFFDHNLMSKSIIKPPFIVKILHHIEKTDQVLFQKLKAQKIRTLTKLTAAIKNEYR